MPKDAEIGREARIRNAALEPLAFLIGRWTTEGRHPLVPGKIFHGRTSFEWHEGGAFLIMHSEIDEPEIPSGVAIFSTDGDRAIIMAYFDERGVSRTYAVTASDNGLVWARDDEKLSQTMTITRDETGDRLLAKGQMSEHRGPWKDDLSLMYAPTDAV